MTIKIVLSTDNSAFEHGAGREVARILRKLAETVEDWPGKSEFSIGLLDFNGNKVGGCDASDGDHETEDQGR
jgi:hypothetical protein